MASHIVLNREWDWPFSPSRSLYSLSFFSLVPLKIVLPTMWVAIPVYTTIVRLFLFCPSDPTRLALPVPRLARLSLLVTPWCIMPLFYTSRLPSPLFSLANIHARATRLPFLFCLSFLLTLSLSLLLIPLPLLPDRFSPTSSGCTSSTG